MKLKTLFLSTIIASLPLLNVAHASTEKSSEYESVVSTTYKYFDGLHRGSKSLMKDAFDMKSGNVKSFDEGKISAITLKDFSGYFTSEAKETWKGKILSVDIVDERMAFVKFDFDTPDIHYIDYLILMKSDKGWKITSKAYVENQK
ncbi:hypothetical protein CW749_21385 [Vibrio sp. vnigr-6D03]|uniref:nuclear transport factor 2 family protein n=1 Tax=Vibrio sp. vnigr-6D03 TaxID=2058088 RepID=UPI000C324242|nr:nuclear transport factor 2 family protein [Vibrio sp. vnigr-6D03]PKF77639.1 hypothetical protein CW749_21385 [Vibrio sp. vnigr-6D03]